MNSASQLDAKARSYLDLWSKYISDGLTHVKGTAVTAEAIEQDSAAKPSGSAPEGGIWIRAFGGKAGEHAFILAADDARCLARLLGGAPPDAAAELTAESRDAIVQFFQQVATMIPAADWLGIQSELEVSEADRPAWESAGEITFRFSTPEGPQFELEAALSADFLAALQNAGNEGPATRRESKAAAPAAAAGISREANLELLLDVELEVALRFGQREMVLGDILKLMPGSVIELGRDVHDPVELLIGDRVVAWGEVVTVDGNYGLRITGLASREERIESLRA
ncbi:MAG: FliM/FliN family flagellar motor switch protein [Terriglobia bacterium]